MPVAPIVISIRASVADARNPLAGGDPADAADRHAGDVRQLVKLTGGGGKTELVVVSACQGEGKGLVTDRRLAQRSGNRQAIEIQFDANAAGDCQLLEIGVKAVGQVDRGAGPAGQLSAGSDARPRYNRNSNPALLPPGSRPTGT